MAVNGIPPGLEPVIPEPTLALRAWDGFLIGPENAMAHAAALGLARHDAAAASPLLIVGPSGAGKSRLLRELRVDWRTRHPDATVELWTGDAFASTCLEAAAKRDAWGRLRERLRSLDLLLIDDLDAIGRSAPALSELTHTLESLDRSGARVAITASALPVDDRRRPWPPRLRSLLLGGVAARVELPGTRMRRSFLLERLRERAQLTLSADVIDALAESARDFRTLDGWVTRLAFAARQHQIAQSGPYADRAALELLSDETRTPLPVPELGEFARAVARAFGVSMTDLIGPSRRQALVLPRHLAIHTVRQHTRASFATIGRYFGGRDAKTIRHACAMAAAHLENDPRLAAKVEALLAATFAIPISSAE